MMLPWILFVVMLCLWLIAIMTLSKVNDTKKIEVELFETKIKLIVSKQNFLEDALLEAKTKMDNLEAVIDSQEQEIINHVKYLEDNSDNFLKCVDLYIVNPDTQKEIKMEMITIIEANAIKKFMEHAGLEFTVRDEQLEHLDIQKQITKMMKDAGLKSPDET